MMKILGSKYMSLACAMLNTALAVDSLSRGQWMWFVVTAGFAGYCFGNYIKKSDD